MGSAISPAVDAPTASLGSGMLGISPRPAEVVGVDEEERLMAAAAAVAWCCIV